MKAGQSHQSQSVGLILCGLGVGWLIGMSVSAVVGAVVGGIVATLLAIVGTLAGLDLPNAEPKRESVETGESNPPSSLRHRCCLMPGAEITQPS